MKIPSRLVLALAVSATVGLSACGGGGGGDATTAAAAAASSPASAASAETVPTSATESTQSFLEYAKSLKPTDVIEPLKLQQLLPPVSDTTEPTAIGS